MGSIFGGGEKQTQTTKPVLSDNQENLLESSSDIVNKLTSSLRNPDGSMNLDNYQKLIAGFNPDQLASQQQIRNIAGSPDFTNLINNAYNVGNAGASVAGQGQGYLGQAANLMGQGAQTANDSQQWYATAGDLIRGASQGPDIDQFLNPYQKNVTDATIADWQDQTARQAAQMKAQQAKRGAFGSQADVASSNFQGDSNRTLATTLANLNAQGFNTALQAGQNQQNVLLQGAQGMTGIGNGIQSLGGTIAGIGQNFGGLASTAGNLGSQLSGIGSGLASTAGAKYSGLLGQQQALAGSGALQQAQQQAGIDAPLTTAGKIAGMAAGYPSGSSTTSSSPGADPFSQILGAGLAGASFFKFANGGLAATKYADGGLGGARPDMSVWQKVTTDEIRQLAAEAAQNPADPEAALLDAVLQQRLADERGSARDDAGRGAGLSAVAAPRNPGIFNAGAPRSEPYAAGNANVLGLGGEPADMFPDAPPAPIRDREGAGRADPRDQAAGLYATQGQRAPVAAVLPPAQAREGTGGGGLAAVARTPQTMDRLPTSLADLDPLYAQEAQRYAADQAQGPVLDRAEAEARAERDARENPFLGGAPQFATLDVPPENPPLDLSKGTFDMGPFGKLAAAAQGLMATTDPVAQAVTQGRGLAAAAGAPAGGRGLSAVSGGGGGDSLSTQAPLRLVPSSPSSGGLMATRQDAAPVAAPAPAAADTGGGWRDRLNGALDNPLLYIGLNLMASRNPSFLGALGEGASNGIGMYTQREAAKAKYGIDAAKEARQAAKDATDQDIARQKLQIDQLLAQGKITKDQADIANDTLRTQAAQLTAGKNSTADKLQALRDAGFDQATITRIMAGSSASVGDADRTEKAILDLMGKNPGMTLEEATAQVQGARRAAQKSTVSSSDLLSLAEGAQ